MEDINLKSIKVEEIFSFKINLKSDAYKKKSLCRTCLSSLEDIKYDIFSNLHLKKFLSNCTSQEANENDGLPRYLCVDCHTKVIEFYNFREMCLTSFQKYYEYIKNLINVNDNIGNEGVDFKNCNDFQNEIKEDCDMLTILTNLDEEVPLAKNTLSEIVQTKEGSFNNNDNDGIDGESYKNNLNQNIPDELPFVQLIENEQNNGKGDRVNDSHTSESSSTTEENQLYEKSKYKKRKIRKIMTSKIDNKKKLKKPIKKSNSNCTNSGNQRINNNEMKKYKGYHYCQTCNKKFLSKDKCEACMRTHKGLKPWPCSECGKEYNTSRSLRSHIKYDHRMQPLIYLCSWNDCNKGFRTKTAMQNHLKIIHLGETQTTKDNKNQKSFICDICGAIFSLNGSLKRHRFIHTGEFPFKCEQCPTKFNSKYHLEIHMKRHQGIKNFTCEICGLKKVTQRDLDVHMNVHTREKLYKCRFCSYTYVTSNSVVLHEKTVHLGIKTLECKFCERKFGRLSILKSHLMTHTGEKPHECKICGKGFIQGSALRVHLKTHGKKNLLSLLPSAALKDVNNSQDELNVKE